MLTSRVIIPPPTNISPEDIFSSSLSSLFTDDVQNSHGDPGSTVIYNSPHFGPLTLHIPSHPSTDKNRQLFAHYLWNAAVVAAELIERASTTFPPPSSAANNNIATPLPALTPSTAYAFNVSSLKILELGAGTALPSVISALCGAATVAVTDHPDSPALRTGAALRNLSENLNIGINVISNQETKSPRTTSAISVLGYVWGERRMRAAVVDVNGVANESSAALSSSTKGSLATNTDSTSISSPSSLSLPPTESRSDVQPDHNSYDRIFLCDCLWLASQHANLVRSVEIWLSRKTSSSRAIVIAGFHTGRRIVADFFDLVNGSTSEQTMTVEELFEIDIEGERREWARARDGESKEQAKRWCAVGILKKR